MNYTRICAWALACALALALAACSGSYQRGIFTGYVVEASEDAIASKVGKPDRVDTSDPNAIKWVYNKKTFDPDNQNRIDEQTIVVLKKDPATGKWKGSDVVFL